MGNGTKGRLRVVSEANETLLSEEFKDSRRAERGKVAEYLVAERLALLGWTIYPEPIFGCPKIDLLAAKNDRYVRVQVKTAMHGKLDLRSGGGRRTHTRIWRTVTDDVDFVVGVVPSNHTIAEMFRADFYVLPSRVLTPFQNVELFGSYFEGFRNNWGILDRCEALADLDVVPSQYESENFWRTVEAYIPGMIVFESTDTDKTEVIFANCARKWKPVYDRFGEDSFICRFNQQLTEATIHGLVHLLTPETARRFHGEMTVVVRRLAWETG